MTETYNVISTLSGKVHWAFKLVEYSDNQNNEYCILNRSMFTVCLNSDEVIKMIKFGNILESVTIDSYYASDRICKSYNNLEDFKRLNAEDFI